MSKKPSRPSRFSLSSLKGKQERFRQEMWKQANPAQNFAERSFYAVLRVAAITWTGVRENRILNRSASLSFSSLLSLGPLVALVVLASGFVLDQIGTEFAAQKIEEVISFIAPQAEDYKNAEQATNRTAESIASDADLNGLIHQFIEGSRSTTVGITGLFLLILIVIQLFSAIEDAFNDIWGVRRGRAWVSRVGMYWTVITLGAVLVFAGLSIFTAKVASFDSALENEMLKDWLAFMVQVASAVTIVFILAIFYRFIPNTQVTWKASLIGALFTVATLVINNEATFFYLQRTVLNKSLYGSVAVIPVLMFGLFIFWFILLLGGRVTYAVQNAHFRSIKIVWDELSYASQESLSLLILARICRQFQNCLRPLTAGELAESTALPVQLINASLNRLCDLDLVAATPPSEKEDFQAFRYRPAKPLERLSLGEFKRIFENKGAQPDHDLFDQHDPIVKKYHALLVNARKESIDGLTLKSALDEFPDCPELKSSHLPLS